MLLLAAVPPVTSHVANKVTILVSSVCYTTKHGWQLAYSAPGEFFKIVDPKCGQWTSNINMIQLLNRNANSVATTRTTELEIPGGVSSNLCF